MQQQIYEQHLLSRPRYRCCCQSCNVFNGAIVVAVVVLVLDVLDLFLVLLAIAQGSFQPVHLIQVIFSPIGIVTVALLFFGLSKEKPVFLIPFIVYQIVAVVLTLIGAAYGIIQVFQQKDEKINGILKEHHSVNSDFDERHREAVEIGYYFGAVIGVTIVLLFCVLFLWFARIAFLCYRYLKEKQSPNATSAFQVQYQVNTMGYGAPPPYPRDQNFGISEKAVKGGNF